MDADTDLPADLRCGVRDTLPLLLGIVPFALVSGVAAVKAGLTFLQAMGLSIVVFAGASQLAALGLVEQGAPLAVVVITAVVINLRMLMYSASIATYFREFSLRVRGALAYGLTDQVYALAMNQYTSDRSVNKPWYYVGVAATLWVVWQAGTVVGLLAGAGLPSAWRLEFTVPLVFVSVLVPTIDSKPALVAALVGGGIAVAGTALPLKVGLLVGGVAGIVAGTLAEGRL